eukprot:COSAG04_NODE_81_length_27945_cov_46.142821_22_plen_773_part_00
MMENPLAGAARRLGGGAGGEQEGEIGPFPLTLKDMFTNTHVVDVAPETKIHKVKELLRDVKKAQADEELSSARDRLAQIESEQREQQVDEDQAQLAAREAQKVAAAEHVAQREAQARELDSLDFVDSVVLLYDQNPLDDETTVGSHGLSRETTVGISSQDVAKGRERRRERGERALRDSIAADQAAEEERAQAERRAEQIKVAVVRGAGLLFMASFTTMIWLVFGVWGVVIEALAGALSYALWLLPAESEALKVLGMQNWSPKLRAGAVFLLAQGLMLPIWLMQGWWGVATEALAVTLGYALWRLPAESEALKVLACQDDSPQSRAQLGFVVTQLMLPILMIFGVWGAVTQVLGCVLSYVLGRLPAESKVIKKLRMQGWSRSHRAAAGVMLTHLLLLLAFFTVGCGSDPCGDSGQCKFWQCSTFADFGSADFGSAGQCSTGVIAQCTCSGNFVGAFCDHNCSCSGHGNQTNITAAREAGSCSAGACACEGNYAGELCEGNCGEHGMSDGRTCTCFGNSIGEFCEGNCGEHGMSDGHTCTCEGDFTGEFCGTTPAPPPLDDGNWDEFLAMEVLVCVFICCCCMGACADGESEEEKAEDLKNSRNCGCILFFVAQFVLLQKLGSSSQNEAAPCDGAELCGEWSLGDMIMRSDYNGARVQAVEYTGEPTWLSWELQHSLCAAAGRATPGTEPAGKSTSQLDKYCAYSGSDNHVVTDGCLWYGQEFTHVSGTLGGGVGYMCAGSNCVYQVRVEGTAAAADGGQVTLNSGDAVFCSA